MRVILLTLLMLLVPSAHAISADEAAEKLNGPQAPFTAGEKAQAESQIQALINSNQKCSSDSDCINILANCFGCTVPVNTAAANEIYVALAKHHMRFGQCTVECKLDGVPKSVCSSGICVIP